MKLYGSPGCGSAVVEVMLKLARLDYDYVQAVSWQPDENFAALKELNPLGQIPVLVLDDGTVMTESAAMILWLGEKVPGLIPTDDAKRAAFYRWLVFVSANIYAVFPFRDFPPRWVEGEAAQKVFKDKTTDRLKFFWEVLESSLHPAPYALGKAMTAIDLYLAMVSRWSPGRAWFDQHCPKLAGAVALTEKHPIVADIWSKNFE